MKKHIKELNHLKGGRGEGTTTQDEEGGKQHQPGKGRAELDKTTPSRILDTTDCLEGDSTVAKAATATAVAVDTKARAAQGTVVGLKSELAQSQQSRTEAKTHADSLSVITLKPPSEFGAGTVVGRIPGRLAGESLDRLGALYSVWVCRVKSRAKSNTFDWTTRTSWSPTPQT